jgi:NADPH-dependent ferric siderophore reductase
MSRALPRQFKVLNKQYITQNMLRITLQQTDDMPLPVDQDGGYIKLHFARQGVFNNDIEKQLLSNDAACRPLLRTYTIRQQRSDLNEIDVDFVVHEIGPASQWALNCVNGDVMYIAGPGKIKFVDPTADWFLIIGDMTALPAISVNLAKLPADAKGYAVIEVINENDIQTLSVPVGFELTWLVNNQ